MPSNWLVLSNNKTITLDAFVESVVPNYSGNIKFQANLKNDKAQPITTVQVYYWSSEYQQSEINGLDILRSEYRRPTTLLQGHVRVQILRIYCGLSSFSFVISYHEEEVLPLRPIIDKIISTLRSDVCE